MLTPTQIEEARRKLGITPASSTAPTVDVKAELQSAWEDADVKNDAFKGPLDLIREGRGKDNLEIAKGAGKQLVKDITSAGAHKAGPVGKQMMEDAKKRGGGAKKFAEAIESLDEKIEPKGPLQKKGAMNTTVTEAVLPVAPAAKVAKKGLDAAKPVLERAAKPVAETVSKLTKKSPEAILDEAIEVTSPTRYKKESIQAMEKAGTPGGAEKKGIFNTYKPTPTVRDVEVAKSVQGIVSKKSGPIDNIVAVNKEIENVSKGLTEHFAQNKVPFNFEDLRKSAELITPDASLKADGAAFETYNRVRENLLSTMYNYLKGNSKKTGEFGAETDMAALWEGRKVIDDIIENELGTATFGSPQYTGVKAAARDFRNGFNKFIADNIANPGKMEQVNKMHEFLQVSRARGIDIPDEKTAIDMLRKEFGLDSAAEADARAAVFRDTMDRLTRMYEARGNIAESNYRLLDKNAIQRWIKQHPSMSEALKYLIGIGGAGALVNTVVN